MPAPAPLPRARRSGGKRDLDGDEVLPPTPRASDEDGDRPRFRAPGDVAVIADGAGAVSQPDKSPKPRRRDSGTRRRVKR